MRCLAIIFAMTLPALYAEQEVWYDSDGKPVKVTEEKGKSDSVYVPPWVRREAEKQGSVFDGTVRWDSRRTNQGWNGRNYYVYPGYYGWSYPRYHYRCHSPHYHGYRGRWGFYYRGNGVRIRYSR